MKKLLFAVLVFFSATAVFAQATVTEQFQKISTMEQAQKFIDANAPLKPVIFNVVAGKDTTMIAKRLLRQTKGNVFNVGYTTYKVLESNESVKYRASYIFLDGGSLSPAEVDSMKKIITKKIDAGQSFDALSDQYTMDGNTTHGDTGWFFGEEMMPKEFQKAVAEHKIGEVFYVDVPDKQWHYIVKKTYDDDLKKEMTILRANGR